MEPRYAVDLLTGVAGEGRHTELFSMIIRIRTTHTDELVPSDTEFLGIAAHILTKQTFLEIVVSGRHGSVYGIKTAGTNQLKSLVECHAFFNIVAQTLQVAQCGMSLVTMVDIFLDAQLLQQQHTTNTEQNLLLQTVLPVAAIEGMGNGFVEVRVHFVVSIKQIQLHATHVDTPYISVNLIVGVRHINHQWIAVLVKLTLDRQRTEVLCLVVGNLLSVHRQTLGKVSETIEETNGTHIDIRVGSLLHIVTGQHTQTTTIDLQGRVNTILHAEVGH